MTFNRFINNKFISILAIIFVSIEVIPDGWQKPDLLLIIGSCFWLIGAIFVWLRKDWAARLLALLASVYFIRDILLEIPEYRSNIAFFSSEYPGAESFVPYLIFLTMFIESIFLFFFMYFGFFKTKPNVGGPQTT